MKAYIVSANSVSQRGPGGSCHELLLFQIYELVLRDSVHISQLSLCVCLQSGGFPGNSLCAYGVGPLLTVG